MLLNIQVFYCYFISYQPHALFPTNKFVHHLALQTLTIPGRADHLFWGLQSCIHPTT